MIPAHRSPVLVGIGAATRREEDFERALEPMDLMQEAVNRMDGSHERQHQYRATTARRMRLRTLACTWAMAASSIFLAA